VSKFSADLALNIEIPPHFCVPVNFGTEIFLITKYYVRDVYRIVTYRFSFEG